MTQKTDRELLELAAKAAGIEVICSRLDDPWSKDMLVSNSARGCYHEGGPWNPLTDDGDALRLAVKLRLDVTFMLGGLEVGASSPRPYLGALQSMVVDPYAATRRAIVRAAAEIGEQQ